MTDPKSRVQLALELAALAAHDDDANALAKAIMVGGGVSCLAIALSNVLLHLVDERETKLHPIARAHPGKHRQVVDHPAPTSSPSDPIAESLPGYAHEGFTAAEWASRYASLTAAAYPVLAWLPRNDPGARMVAERLEGVLAGKWPAFDDTESALLAAEQMLSASQAELTRLKEENARLAQEAASWESACSVAMSHNGRLAAEAEKALANAKAAHEVTRSELAWERGWDLHRKDAMGKVVEAARDVVECLRVGGLSDLAALVSLRLSPAITALDQPTQAEPATPPESPVPVEAPREVCERLLRMHWLYPNYRVDSRGPMGLLREAIRILWPQLDEYIEEHDFDAARDKFFPGESDPEPPAERPLGEGEL